MQELQAAYASAHFSQRPQPSALKLSLALASMGNVEARVESPTLLAVLRSRLESAAAFATATPKLHDQVVRGLNSRDPSVKFQAQQRLARLRRRRLENIRAYALWKSYLAGQDVQEVYLALQILDLSNNRWGLLSWQSWPPQEVAHRVVELIQEQKKSLL